MFNNSFNDAFRRIMVGYADQLDELKEEEGRRDLRLLFYFNGDLNSQSDIEEQARRQIPCMLNDGYYPVFFVWDTNLIDTYKEQVTRICDGHQTNAIWLGLLSPIRVGGDVFAGISKAPADYFIHSRRFLRAIQRTPQCYLIVQTEQIENVECPKEQHVKFVENHPANGYAPIDGDRNVVIDMNRQKVDANQREVWRFNQYTGIWPVRLISTPLAHGIGGAAWQNMLRRTRTTVRRSIEHYLDRHGYKLTQGLDGDSQHTFHIEEASKCPKDLEEKLREFKQGTGVFASFFESLGRHIDEKKQMPENNWICEGESERPINATDIDRDADKNDRKIAAALKDAEITLIGHSMGAIVINELLTRFPELPYSDILVMAAAASVRDTRATLDRYFSQETENAEKTRFYSLMLHP